jgi:hypothetical protein
MSQYKTLSCIWTTDYLKKLIENKQLNRPRIQRKHVWTKEKDVEYINFLIKTRTAIMPFLVNKIIHFRRVYII